MKILIKIKLKQVYFYQTKQASEQKYHKEKYLIKGVNSPKGHKNPNTPANRASNFLIKANRTEKRNR